MSNNRVLISPVYGNTNFVFDTSIQDASLAQDLEFKGWYSNENPQEGTPSISDSSHFVTTWKSLTNAGLQDGSTLFAVYKDKGAKTLYVQATGGGSVDGSTWYLTPLATGKITLISEAASMEPVVTPANLS